MTKPLKIDLYPLPDLLPADIDPDAAVFIDILRATTTMTAALAAGAVRIIPVADPKETLRLKERMIADSAAAPNGILTGGERKGVKIDGFDFGNSPSEYRPETAAGKTILFSTTNGTRAILSLKSQRAQKFLGSFTAAGALVNRIAGDSSIQTLAVVCAGTNRQYTEEDLLFAGLLIGRLASIREKEALKAGDFSGTEVRLNTAAQTHRRIWTEFEEKNSGLAPEEFHRRLTAELRASHGGQNLVRINLAADIADAVRIDSLGIVAQYRMGEIRAVR